jgi:hypothetical protein
VDASGASEKPRTNWAAIVLAVLVGALVIAGGTWFYMNSLSTVSDAPADKTAAVTKSVARSLQDELDSDPALSRLGLTVMNVLVVQKSGNEYSGVATLRTPKGTENDILLSVTADESGVVWQAPPGAFLFAVQDKLAG